MSKPAKKHRRDLGRCGCGRRATNYAAGYRCEVCREIEESLAANHHHSNAGIVTRELPETYAIHLPKYAGNAERLLD